MIEPKATASAEIVIKKSRFLATAAFTDSPEKVREEIKEMRLLHPEANHVVHAFVCSGGDIFGMSDDREPRGTAGRPVLEVVKGSGINNLLVMVVRYFGGTKLGTGGLVKAYTEAAQEVLKKLKTGPIITCCPVELELSYDLYEAVKKEMAGLFIKPPTETFEEHILITGIIDESTFEHAAEQLAELSSGRAILKKGHSPGSLHRKEQISR
jgi:uncharacterized YigZ family protein